MWIVKKKFVFFIYYVDKMHYSTTIYILSNKLIDFIERKFNIFIIIGCGYWLYTSVDNRKLTKKKLPTCIQRLYQKKLATLLTKCVYIFTNIWHSQLYGVATLLHIYKTYTRWLTSKQNLNGRVFSSFFFNFFKFFSLCKFLMCCMVMKESHR